MALTHFCTVLVVTPISSATSAGSLPSSVTKRTISLLYSSVYLVPLANVDTSSLDRSISHFYVSGKPGNVQKQWFGSSMYSESFLNCLKHYGIIIGTANSVRHYTLVTKV